MKLGIYELDDLRNYLNENPNDSGGVTVNRGLLRLLVEGVELLETIRDRSAVIYERDYGAMRDADWHTADELLEKLP